MSESTDDFFEGKRSWSFIKDEVLGSYMSPYTEILLTMNILGMHRLATRRAVENGRQDEQMIRDFHQTLTDVLGGDYWKNIM